MKQINLKEKPKKETRENLVDISLETLNEFFPKNAPIKVSRKWLEILGFRIDKPPKVVQISVPNPKEKEKPAFSAERL